MSRFGIECGARSGTTRFDCTAAAAPVLVLVSMIVACSGARPVARSTELPTDKQMRCSISKSASRPLIVEWPSADRATLEARIRKGVVPVRYAGCEMEVLDQCILSGRYTYTALTKQHESLVVRDVDDLWAKLPLGAASLEGTLKSEGALSLVMTMVGRYEWAGTPRRRDLEGHCERATHVIAGLVVGAFEFYTGTEEKASAGGGLTGMGAGARRLSARRTINQAGEESACEQATTQDAEPPSGCGAMLRVEVIPIADATADDSSVVASARPAGPPAPAPKVRLTVSGATVRDNHTGLVWQRTVPSVTMGYAEARQYCAGLRRSEILSPPGTDEHLPEATPATPPQPRVWRLPTREELIAFAGADPAMQGVFWAEASPAPDEFSKPERDRWVVRGNLLAGAPRSRTSELLAAVEMPGGVPRWVQSATDKLRVRCVR